MKNASIFAARNEKKVWLYVSRNMGNTSATYGDVKAFLDQMKNRLSNLAGYVVYDRRDKNEQFMLDMDWDKPDIKKEWLLKLEPLDYYEGPDDNARPGYDPVWKFGKRILGRLCYIKVFLLPKNNVYCVSFHLAEHDMYLPLKQTTEKQ